MPTVERRTKAIIFVNASSGWDSKEDAPQKLEHWFAESGIDAHIEYFAKGVNLADKAREAVTAGNDIVVAGGGDGTLSATASGLVGTEVAFGVLPVGTLNHFARDLNLPLDLEQAAKIVCQGKTEHVDVGEANGKTFLNNAILGLYPVFRFLRAEQERKGMPSRLAMVRATASALWRMPHFRLRFIVGGQEIVRRTPYVLIGNNEHAMDGYQLGFRECLCEGKLWIYIMRNHGRLGLMNLLLKIAAGQFHGPDHFEIFQAEELYVEARSRRMGVALDGEIHVMESPLRFRILPRSLRVIVP